jgi:nucleotide-binding universal stress UspA family protein
MKRILVPCDFSEPAVQAFRFAVDLVKASRGEIFLLNVIELPTLYDSTAVLAFEANYMQDMKDEAQKKFKRLKEKWSLEGIKVRGMVEFGGLLSTVRDTVKKVKADLVVVGTHGAGGLREYTVGSNTEKLVRTIDIPLIAVKKTPKAIRNIVFPTTPDMEMEELTMKVKELQNFFKANIHVLFVNTPAFFKRDQVIKPALEAFAKRFMLKDYTLNVYNDISEEEGIINFSRGIKADLVAMRTHGRRGLAHIATGSIAEDVVNHIECPIWTLRIK